MKKALSILLAVFLTLSAGITAFAAKKSEIGTKIEDAAQYLLGEEGYEEFESYTSETFLVIIKSGADVSDYTEYYLASVKEALDSDLMSAADYAYAILVLDLLGKDPADFEGYDLVSAFAAYDDSEDYINPYYYVGILDAAKNYVQSDTLTEHYAAQLTALYTMGEGTDFWGGYGTSPDDLGYFITALAVCGDQYQEYIKDACAVIETMVTDEGYTSWGAANANSTACALMAYAAISDKDRADAAYELLSLFESDNNGVYTGSWSDAIATEDALRGLEYYYLLLEDEKKTEATESTTEAQESKKSTVANSTAQVTTAAATATTVKASDSKTSPETGANYAGIAVGVAVLIGLGVVLMKKRES